MRDILQRLTVCRTAAMGGHLARCTHCGWSRPVYNPCGDRHCPTCQGSVRARWLQERLERLLPVGHFQVVFTLPSELRPWAWHSPKIVYNALFTAAAATLSELADSRLGRGRRTDLGVLAVLHTWANDLSFHPHVHTVVTAGGLSTDDEGQPSWAPSRAKFLFPVRVLGALFRGKLLAALRAAWDAGELPDPPSERFDLAAKDAWRKRWVVHVDPPAGRDPTALTKYLARYVRGVAISDRRVQAMTNDSVTIQTRRGPVTLPGQEFVRRFSQHILPKRLHAVRYYGLYAPNQAMTRFVDAWRVLRAAGAHVPEPPLSRVQRQEFQCPSCGGELGVAPIDGVPSERRDGRPSRGDRHEPVRSERVPRLRASSGRRCLGGDRGDPDQPDSEAARRAAAAMAWAGRGRWSVLSSVPGGRAWGGSGSTATRWRLGRSRREVGSA